MHPALLPGTLFVLLVALAAVMNRDPDVIVILALACAVAWASQIENFPHPIRISAWVLSIALFAMASILLATRILL